MNRRTANSNIPKLVFILLTGFTISCNTSPEQSNHFFKEIIPANKSGIQIIGVTPLYDRAKINEKYSFYINSPEGLNYLKDSIVFGSENFTMTPDHVDFSIYAVEGKLAHNAVININPQNENVIYKHRYFNFETAQLEKLAKKYPIHYRIEHRLFETEDQYQYFVANQASDSTLLFYQNITSEFPGQAIIVMKRSTEIDSWESGMDLLKAAVAKLRTNENEYLLSYNPQENESQVFQFEISSSESIYNQLQNPLFEKAKWIKTVKEVIVYWKK